MSAPIDLGQELGKMRTDGLDVIAKTPESPEDRRHRHWIEKASMLFLMLLACASQLH